MYDVLVENVIKGVLIFGISTFFILLGVMREPSDN